MQAEEEPAVMDPLSAIGAGKVAQTALQGSAGLLRRVLGPVSVEFGEFLQQYAHIKFRNVLRAAERADARLADREVSDEPIPGRVARRILDEAAYCDDEDDITVEYLGGLLASSRIAGKGSDVANSHAALISRMASNHLRLHYALYRFFHYVYSGQEVNFYSLQVCNVSQCFVPIDTLLTAFPQQQSDLDIPSAAYWLDRERLATGFNGGPKPRPWVKSESSGLIFTPQPLGVELFLWGLGRPSSVKSFLSTPGEAFDVAGLDLSFDGIERVQPVGDALTMFSPESN